MVVHLDSKSFKSALKSDRLRLFLILGQNNAAYIKSDLSENIEKTYNINIICYAKIASYFILFNSSGIDNDNDLGFVFQLKKHLKLAVRLETGKNS